MSSNLLAIFLVISAYWIVSISLVFVNKWLLSDNSAELDIPFFILWFQAIISALIIIVARFVCERTRIKDLFKDPVIARFEARKFLQLLPLSVIFCLMTTFNNLSLKLLGVSFYYVARSLTTLFNVLFTYIILKTTTSMQAIACCALLMVGYIIGSVAESESHNLSFIGLAYGIMASACVALYAIFTKKYTQEVESNAWNITFYNNCNSLLILIFPIVLNQEHHSVYNSNPRNDYSFWILMTIGGVLGFLIAFVATLQIKYTSALTHNVSGTAKAAFQTLLGVMAYHEVKSGLWWFGNVLVLFSSSLYTYVRHKEMKSNSTDKTILKVYRDRTDAADTLIEDEPSKFGKS